jgi:hypothetical protein
MVRGDKKYVDELVQLLKISDEALGMKRKLTRKSSMPSVSMNSCANQFGLYGPIGNGQKKGTSPSSGTPHLAFILTNLTWINFFTPVKIAKKLDY